MADHAGKLVTGLLQQADVKVNGGRPWDIEVLDERWFGRVLGHGSLGAGEAWMDGWWRCRALDQFLERIFSHQLQNRLKLSWSVVPQYLWQRLINAQSPRRAFTVGERHYDAGNDLFERMLDRRMVYSCGYWRSADCLDDAQEAKLDLICRKLDLQPGQRLLDIGCGWGSLAQYAAEVYGVEVVGVTVSREQAMLARERCAGLPVDIRLCDYREFRDIDESFDHVASVGMVEHVGSRNYATYMKVAERCLKPG
ncbi:MAG: class I SAM-dependent methyltransferase, partial [Wenzhouxiangella sp.]